MMWVDIFNSHGYLIDLEMVGQGHRSELLALQNFGYEDLHIRQMKNETDFSASLGSSTLDYYAHLLRSQTKMDLVH